MYRLTSLSWDDIRSTRSEQRHSRWPLADTSFDRSVPEVSNIDIAKSTSSTLKAIIDVVFKISQILRQQTMNSRDSDVRLRDACCSSICSHECHQGNASKLPEKSSDICVNGRDSFLGSRWLNTMIRELSKKQREVLLARNFKFALPYDFLKMARRSKLRHI